MLNALPMEKAIKKQVHQNRKRFNNKNGLVEIRPGWHWIDKVLWSRVLVNEMLYRSYEVTHIVVVVSIWLAGTNFAHVSYNSRIVINYHFTILFTTLESLYSPYDTIVVIYDS